MTDFKDMKFQISRGCGRGLCHRACGRQDKQLNTYDWLADVPGNDDTTDLVEVQFKNTRKGYYHNVNHLDLKKGDIVAVEASPGHDIGVVTLTGRLVKLQVKKAKHLSKGSHTAQSPRIPAVSPPRRRRKLIILIIYFPIA